MIRIFLFLISINLLNIGVAQNAASADHAAPLVRGCYHSVDEFFNNSPSMVDSFYVDSVERKHQNWEGTYNTIPKYAEKKFKVVKNIWGFCDGENVFVFHQNEYFQLYSDSIGYYFVGFDFIDREDIPLSAATAYALGNSAGGEAILLDKAQSVLTLYYIDLHTGWALHPNAKYNVGMPAEHIVFYRNSRKEANLSMEILVNDILQLRILPDTYFTEKFLYGTQDIRICYGENFESCSSFALEAREIDYFEISIPEKTKVPEVIKVTDSKGEFYSDSALKAQQRRKKKAEKQ